MKSSSLQLKEMGIMHKMLVYMDACMKVPVAPSRWGLVRGRYTLKRVVFKRVLETSERLFKDEWVDVSIAELKVSCRIGVVTHDGTSPESLPSCSLYSYSSDDTKLGETLIRDPAWIKVSEKKL